MYKMVIKTLKLINSNSKTRRKRLIWVIIVCTVLLVLFALNCYLFNFLSYPKWGSLSHTEYSVHSSPLRLMAGKHVNHSPNTSLDAIHQIKNDYSIHNLMNNDSKNSQKNKKIILLWTPFFGQSDYVQPTYDNSRCPHSNCIFTSNRSRVEEADAVMFHLRDLSMKDWPQYRRPDQRYILLNHESPPNTPNILNQLNGQINWTATYRYGSDIFLSPLFRRRTEPNPQFKPNVNYHQNKTRMIAWLASNCKTDSNRETYVEELKKTITVDVYGKCGHKTCLPKMSSKCLEQVAKEYRFILAFENSICRDYVTEKYFNPLGYDIIPIVFGGSDYKRIAPKKSFIDALSYSSPRHLARFLLYLSKNVKQYNEYFNWKHDYELTVEPYSCQICRKLNNREEPAKVWHQLERWWFDEAQCRTWMPSKYTN